MTINMILDKDYFMTCFEKIADLAEEQRNYWTKLDSDIGDGDHGINLSIGFRAVREQLPELKTTDVDLSQLFKKVGMTLLGKVGGASGPLYGSLLMKMGAGLEGRYDVSFEEFVTMLSKGTEAVRLRGKAEIGDKTMIDALLPGIDVLKKSSLTDSPSNRMSQYIEELKAGAERTVPLVAKKGRATRLGERAIGHKDPGAESSWMIMRVFAEEIKMRE